MHIALFGEIQNLKSKNAPQRTFTVPVMNRRHFLAQSTAVLGFPAITRCASPNSLLNVASVGVAKMGGNTMRSVASHKQVQIVALCDVDAKHLAEGAALHPKASQHRDWRELIANHADSFDAITIGTPDHTHAPIAVSALRAKKHVYLQKPMAPTIHECRVIAAEAAKAGVRTQLGNQGRSTIESRMTVELIRSGAIGKVKEVLFWENKRLSWWPKNEDLRPVADALPAELMWDLWVGPSGMVPYLAQTYHPSSWRALRGFGAGELGDMGCHHFDATVDALKLQAPLRARHTHRTAGKLGLWAPAREVEFHFAGNELIAGDTLKLTWCDGEHRPDAAKIPMPSVMKELPPSGQLWIGERGSIFRQYGKRPYVLPEADFPSTSYPSSIKPQDHYHDWVDAILEGHESCDPFSHGANLTECVLVGNLAEDVPVGEWVEWNREAGTTNHPALNEKLQPKYREGWSVPGLG
jgi:predicted dehydrogenase